MHELEHHVIRTTVALCALAAVSDDARVRDDMRDEAFGLLQVWIHGTSRNDLDACRRDLQRWSRRMATELHALSSDGTSAALVAHTAVVRLQLVCGPEQERASESAETPATPRVAAPGPRPVSIPGVGPKKVLEFIREHTEVRAKDIVQKFSGSLSDRTVKRSLQSLVAAGQLIRTEEASGVVMYKIVS